MRIVTRENVLPKVHFKDVKSVFLGANYCGCKYILKHKYTKKTVDGSSIMCEFVIIDEYGRVFLNDNCMGKRAKSYQGEIIDALSKGANVFEFDSLKELLAWAYGE